MYLLHFGTSMIMTTCLVMHNTILENERYTKRTFSKNLWEHMWWLSMIKIKLTDSFVHWRRQTCIWATSELTFLRTCDNLISNCSVMCIMIYFGYFIHLDPMPCLNLNSDNAKLMDLKSYSICEWLKYQSLNLYVVKTYFKWYIYAQ
jgi:magnesium-transporting ATPase (P-type)